MPTSVTPLTLLTRGAVNIKGRMPWSSNATFLVEVVLDGMAGLAVYKPQRGERPLWDFPRGLFKREIAAYLLSEALGWGVVPLTVPRDDGPYGAGSLQLFMDADFEQHYFTLVEDAAHHDRLQRICVFDLVANNADRKAVHCLRTGDGLVWAIDNGLTFHEEPKLRTVIWAFGVAIIGVLLAETKLSNQGLGYLIIQSYTQFNMPQMYAMLIIVFILAAVVNAAFGRLGDRSMSKQKRTT